MSGRAKACPVAASYWTQGQLSDLIVGWFPPKKGLLFVRDLYEEDNMLWRLVLNTNNLLKIMYLLACGEGLDFENTAQTNRYAWVYASNYDVAALRLP